MKPTNERSEVTSGAGVKPSTVTLEQIRYMKDKVGYYDITKPDYKVLQYALELAEQVALGEVVPVRVGVCDDWRIIRTIYQNTTNGQMLMNYCEISKTQPPTGSCNTTDNGRRESSTEGGQRMISDMSFRGKPIADMDKPELLTVIEYLLNTQPTETDKHYIRFGKMAAIKGGQR